jgi:hypothetical protein
MVYTFLVRVRSLLSFSPFFIEVAVEADSDEEAREMAAESVAEPGLIPVGFA